MNADLEALVNLQDTHDQIAVLTARIDIEIPGHIAEIETELRLVRERVEEGRAAIEAARRERARLDLELKAAEEKIAKYKTALMQVKNNDEYRAALNEIDYTQRICADLETRVLELMEAADARQNELDRLEEEMKVEDVKIQSDRQLLEAEREEVVAERGGLEKMAQEIEERLPAPLLVSFRRIASMRRGHGLARAQDGVCVACNVRLRPAVFQQVKRNETVISCDSCRRILYWVPPVDDDEAPPPVASQEVASPPAGTASAATRSATGPGE
ncbi:MAG: zinc ribbon domain-containing protein [Acidobacteriota bacterium]